MRNIVLALTLLLSVPAAALAQPVTWMFTGTTTSTTSPDPVFSAQFPAGLPVSLRVTYNPAAPESTQSNPHLGNPAIGRYDLLGANTGVLHVDVETRIGARRWHLSGSPEQIYVRANMARLHNDGSLIERLKGDLVSALVLWKPHYREWNVGWPGFSFASDALPSAFPHVYPGGTVVLHFRTCGHPLIDPCPAGVQEQRSQVHMALSQVRPVFTQRIDVQPGNPLNLIDRTARATPVAILGNQAFQPAVQIDRSTIELSKASVHTSSGQPACSTSDVNKDGYSDLVCQVRTEQITPREHEPSVARLIAMTTDGNYIQGSQTIQFVN